MSTVLLSTGVLVLHLPGALLLVQYQGHPVNDSLLYLKESSISRFPDLPGTGRL